MSREHAQAVLAFDARARRLLPAMRRMETLLYGEAFAALDGFWLDTLEEMTADLAAAITSLRERHAHAAKVAKLRDTHGRTGPEAATALRLADRLEAKGRRVRQTTDG